MSEKKSIKISFKSILIETAITIVLFLLLSMFVTVLINGGFLKPQYLKPISMLSLFISSITAAVIRRTGNVVKGLLNAAIIILIIIIVSACQKGSGADAKNTILRGIVVALGKVIPNVIKTSGRRSKKRKRAR